MEIAKQGQIEEVLTAMLIQPKVKGLTKESSSWCGIGEKIQLFSASY